MRLFQIAMLVLLLSQPASSQIAIKLLNPDGTPATNVNAIAIKNRDAVLDPKLQVILPTKAKAPKNPFGENSKPEAEDLIVTVSADSTGQYKIPAGALGLMASSDKGFAFLPKPDKPREISLRAWSSLKLNTSTMPESLRDRYRLKVIWRNSFAGSYPHQNLNFEEDPLTESDWRFARYVEWTHILDVKDQNIRVPPGEVTIRLQEYNNGVPWSSEFAVGLVRVHSNEELDFSLPAFGSATGKWSMSDVLPDWSSHDGTHIFAVGRTITIPEKLRVLLQGTKSVDADPFGQGHHINLDELAKYYSSPEGTAFRYSSEFGVHHLLPDAKGDFRFELLPVGQYRLRAHNRQKMRGERPCAKIGQSQPIEFTVAAGKTSELGEVTDTVEPSIESIGDESVDPFGGPSTLPSNSKQELSNKQTIDRSPQIVDPKKAHARILEVLKLKLQDGINYPGIPLTRVVQQLMEEYKIPILIDTRKLEQLQIDLDVPITLESPPISLRSLLNLVLSGISSDLTFAVRDEVLMITSKEDAEKNNADTENFGLYSESWKAENLNDVKKPLDLTRQVIQQWLKSNGKNTDTAEIRKLIQKQVESEFDAKQTERRTEIKRLRDLLEHSAKWLDTREVERKQIIEQRTVELLKDLQ